MVIKGQIQLYKTVQILETREINEENVEESVESLVSKILAY